MKILLFTLLVFSSICFAPGGPRIDHGRERRLLYKEVRNLMRELPLTTTNARRIEIIEILTELYTDPSVGLKIIRAIAAFCFNEGIELYDGFLESKKRRRDQDDDNDSDDNNDIRPKRLFAPMRRDNNNNIRRIGSY